MEIIRTELFSYTRIPRTIFILMEKGLSNKNDKVFLDDYAGILREFAEKIEPYKIMQQLTVIL